MTHPGSALYLGFGKHFNNSKAQSNTFFSTGAEKNSSKFEHNFEEELHDKMETLTPEIGQLTLPNKSLHGQSSASLHVEGIWDGPDQI